MAEVLAAAAAQGPDATGLARSVAAAAATTGHRCFASSTAGVEAPKAAMMVIGDEVLAGSITDANTPWLAKASGAGSVI